MQTILADPVLRALLFRSITAFLAMGFTFAFYTIYAIRELHLSPAAFGVIIAMGGVGSLVGGSVAGRVVRRFGMRPSFFGSAVLIGCAMLLIPLASVFPKAALLFLVVQQFAGDLAWTVYAVNETTLRQSVTPEALLGRVNAAMQLASRGMLPLGALAGGFLGSSLGIRNTLWIAGSGVLLSAIWLLPLARAERGTRA